MGKKVVIGLVGQVCAGKSTVAGAFASRGAQLYDADKHVHALYDLPDVIAQVREKFGDAVVGNGRVNRKALAGIVFSDPAKLKALTEQIIFPRTGAEVEAQLEKFRASDAPALVLDAPTLFESGRDGVCDYIVFVSAPQERREKWGEARGWDAQELKRREARMSNEAQKRARADAIIDNSGTIEETRQKTWEVFDRFVQRSSDR